MECPDCGEETEAESGYSKKEDEVILTETCPKCEVVFAGILRRLDP